MKIRTILLVVFTILVVGLIGAGVAYHTVTRPFPQTEGTLVVEGLSAPVTIRRNADGVPLITASTIEDLFFAQGFVHAQDRLFQMDVQRRAEQTIEGDLIRNSSIARDLIFLEAADPALENILESYSRGVNAYVATAPQLPVEYQWLGIEWDPWDPKDSLVVMESYGQAVRAADDYQQSWRLSPAQTESQKRTLVQVLSFAPPPLLNPWYVNRLESPEVQATGVSLMGVPFVVAGENGEIAWIWKRVRHCSESVPTSFALGNILQSAGTVSCDVDLVSWFTKARGYNHNTPLPLPPSTVPSEPTTWLDTRKSGSAPASIVALFGQTPPIGIAPLTLKDESNIAEWVAALNSVPSDNIIIQRAQEQLGAWNGEMHPDLPGALLYRVVKAFTVQEIILDEIPDEQVPSFLAVIPEGFDFILDPVYAEHWDDIRTPDIESRDDMIARAWERAHDYLGRRFGDVPHEWAWGRLHYATFRHPLTDRFPILDRLLTRTVPLAGDATTLIPIPEDLTNDFKPSAIPSLRVVLSPGGDFYFAYPGGQSAHPFHPHATTFLDAWATGDLVKLEWNGEDEAVLELVERQ